MEWADETILRLRALWDEGHSTAEIGRRLGVSKNAVVGKAHRLDLPARPSPIRRDGGAPRAKRPSVRRPPVAGPTLPPLACLSEAEAASLRLRQASTRAPASVSVPRSVTATSATAPASRLQPVAPRPYGRVITCCWPIGEPGTSSFRFCDEASVPGKPYCEEHADLAYVRIRDKREDAA